MYSELLRQENGTTHTHKKQTDCRSSQSEPETDAWKDVRGAAEEGKKQFKNELQSF